MSYCLKCGMLFEDWSIKFADENFDSFVAVCIDCEGEHGDIVPIDGRPWKDLKLEAIESLVAKQEREEE